MTGTDAWPPWRHVCRSKRRCHACARLSNSPTRATTNVPRVRMEDHQAARPRARISILVMSKIRNSVCGLFTSPWNCPKASPRKRPPTRRSSNRTCKLYGKASEYADVLSVVPTGQLRVRRLSSALRCRSAIPGSTALATHGKPLDRSRNSSRTSHICTSCCARGWATCRLPVIVEASEREDRDVPGLCRRSPISSVQHSPTSTGHRSWSASQFACLLRNPEVNYRGVSKAPPALSSVCR